MTQLANDNTPYNPKMGDGSRGLVQYVKEGAQTAGLFGSLNGVNYQLIHTFDASDIKELALPPFILISGAVGSVTPVIDGSKCYISETR